MARDIIFPIDLEHESSWKPVLPIAVQLARARSSPLCVLTVIPKMRTTPGLPNASDFGEDVPSLEQYSKMLKAAAENQLTSFVKKHIPQDIEGQAIVRSGSIYRQILEVASEKKADLIVMSAYRPSLKTYLLGTNAERVARHADCSVYIVRP